MYDGNMHCLALFILIGWHDDDLPLFSGITGVLSCELSVLPISQSLHMSDQHFDSHVIEKSYQEEFVLFHELNGYPPVAAHSVPR